jgi:hypothetical protein
MNNVVSYLSHHNSDNSILVPQPVVLKSIQVSLSSCKYHYIRVTQDCTYCAVNCDVWWKATLILQFQYINPELKQYFVAVNCSWFDGSRRAYLVRCMFSWIVPSRKLESAAVERICQPGLLQVLQEIKKNYEVSTIFFRYWLCLTEYLISNVEFQWQPIIQIIEKVQTDDWLADSRGIYI